ncbi:hypothetical protein ESOMN_v1c02020 [Williamsoniiplasma somnilux]|uniref:Uncharacterized protein n=1 Tax=Williamsoniiplasma somnilux TaxID=215578 RepID=A0A2K8NYF5_9MOLU|nr:hypothetical protein [Williamsoniiplasma somnilux]ATZ18586.1 hypothetical protein ESOMN_v1c02020 [Williamsoniiplasma somnilux]
MFWNKNRKLKKGLKQRSFLESAWITNFWIKGDYLYLTNATSDKDKSSLSMLSIGVLKENLDNKNEIERKFISDPLLSNHTNLTHQLTDVTLISQYQGYLLDLTFNNNQIPTPVLVSTKPELKPILKIVENFAGKFVLTNEYKIYLNNELIYDESGEINICNFGTKNILISSKNNRELFYFKDSHFRERVIVSKGNYFFRLECYKQDLIIGKPMYDRFNEVNYFQPVIFIY